MRVGALVGFIGLVVGLSGALVVRGDLSGLRVVERQGGAEGPQRRGHSARRARRPRTLGVGLVSSRQVSDSVSSAAAGTGLEMARPGARPASLTLPRCRRSG